MQLELDQFALGPACPQVFGLFRNPSSLLNFSRVATQVSFLTVPPSALPSRER